MQWGFSSKARIEKLLFLLVTWPSQFIPVLCPIAIFISSCFLPEMHLVSWGQLLPPSKYPEEQNVKLVLLVAGNSTSSEFTASIWYALIAEVLLSGLRQGLWCVLYFGVNSHNLPLSKAGLQQSLQTDQASSVARNILAKLRCNNSLSWLRSEPKDIKSNFALFNVMA